MYPWNSQGHYLFSYFAFFRDRTIHTVDTCPEDGYLPVPGKTIARPISTYMRFQCIEDGFYILQLTVATRVMK